MKTEITTKSATHSPLPWRIRSSAIVAQRGHVESVIAMVYAPNGPDCSPAELAANKTIIVRAVNSHAELVAALESTEQDACWNDGDTVASLRVRLDNLAENARASLAKARQ